jgi:DNA-binding transcriptional MerR regulator
MPGAAGASVGVETTRRPEGDTGDRKAGSVPERVTGSVPERKAGSVPERKAGSVPERETGYTAVQAARLSGCTPAQLDAWRRIGLVVPAAADTSPYSFRDLVALRMVASLLDEGVAMARIRRAVGELLRAGEDIAALLLVSEGDSVLACRDDGQILDVLRNGQLVLFVSVDRMAHEVEAEVRRFDAERTEFVAGLRGRDTHPAGDGVDG